MELKFAFIAACCGVALATYFICGSKRDWFWLNLGMAFTLAADYFLVLHNRHLIGVAVFCFAHGAYIMRTVTAARDKSEPTLTGKRKIFGGTWQVCFLILLAIPAYTALSILLPIGLHEVNTRFAVTRAITGIYVIAALYATLFIVNICVSARHIRHNRRLIVTGLLLFAACDICVLIFNLPHYFGAPAGLTRVFPLIWVFYLPSQVLLALSAVKWQGSAP